MRSGTITIALAALALVLAAGCGGGGEDGAPDAVSKSEYLARANAACKKGEAEIDAAFRRFDGGPPTRAEAEAVIAEDVVPNIQRQIDEVRIGVPEGDEETIDAIADEAEAVLERIRANPGIEFEKQDPFAPVARKLRAYGLIECAKEE